MYVITETSMLIRAQIELPVGLKLKTHGFGKGWNFVESEDARPLENHVLKQGWKLIRVVDGWMRSGVGETSRAAVRNALKLALRVVSPDFNAVDVGYVECTKYPHFVLASVIINPYRIQREAMIPMSDEIPSPRASLGKRLLPHDAPALFPDFASAMPTLKELFTHSLGSQARSL
jgi:hypothetical protein